MVAKSGIWHSTTGAGPPVVLIHGLFGSAGNLGALGRDLADRYTVYSIDLPNHGRSSWVDDPGVPHMANLLRAWLDEQGLARAAFVGHSLGGKVAMQLALNEPEVVSALVAADIAPVTYPGGGHDSIFAALEAVEDAAVDSRAAAAKVMGEHLQEEGVIQFLLMSLERKAEGGYGWRFNLRELHRGYDGLRSAPEGEPFAGPVLFVKGGESNYILPQHREQVTALFPAAQMKVMPGCGHWLHAEQPAQFNRIVGRFLDTHVAAGQALS
ncbi:alpha/beta fold hydrolase [Mangrovimicrobium sediminis]|uniref:Alpha/beta fold hydrolase n=1 Tax=Mangrovimicrobium sediminis TaxID=2562682 RepID=A0A4Z0M5S6_9GAMM|nr:alpha/beta fold hydrolase [Haliea sp. SAOS-164]TGD74728.1 alpha/beta fold hydrolase [Haliea sp. SAOS-164]